MSHKPSRKLRVPVSNNLKFLNTFKYFLSSMIMQSLSANCPSEIKEVRNCGKTCAFCAREESAEWRFKWPVDAACMTSLFGSKTEGPYVPGQTFFKTFV